MVRVLQTRRPLTGGLPLQAQNEFRRQKDHRPRDDSRRALSPGGCDGRGGRRTIHGCGHADAARTSRSGRADVRDGAATEHAVHLVAAREDGGCRQVARPPQRRRRRGGVHFFLFPPKPAENLHTPPPPTPSLLFLLARPLSRSRRTPDAPHGGARRRRGHCWRSRRQKASLLYPHPRSGRNATLDLAPARRVGQ